jgi:hypothetical protein
MEASSSSARSVRAVLMAGGVAGVLDFTAATVNAGVSPARVARYVASGLLGPAAFRGGAGTVVLGFACHFFIALVAAAVYWAASRKLGFLLERPVVWGVLYGVGVYVVMNFVVVPLSAVPPRPWPPPLVPMARMVGIHMFCVGLPISLTLRRCAR